MKIVLNRPFFVEYSAKMFPEKLTFIAIFAGKHFKMISNLQDRTENEFARKNHLLKFNLENMFHRKQFSRIKLKIN